MMVRQHRLALDIVLKVFIYIILSAVVLWMCRNHLSFREIGLLRGETRFSLLVVDVGAIVFLPHAVRGHLMKFSSSSSR